MKKVVLTLLVLATLAFGSATTSLAIDGYGYAPVAIDDYGYSIHV